MNQHEFVSQINRCIETWGEGSFSKQRTDLIWKVCGGLSVQRFARIVDHFISTHRQAPLPNDFIKAFYEEKRKDHETNYNSCDPEPVPIDCHDCYMTGWMFVRTKLSEPIVLMHCHCNHGAAVEEMRGDTFIPRWDKCDVLFAWIKVPFPHRAFVPNTEERKKLLSTGFSEIVGRWNQKKKESEKYWRNLNENLQTETTDQGA